MLEERNLKLDLLALGLLALTIFLAAALLSYDPADPPSTLVYPQRTETTNLCGRIGALASQWSFQALGLGAYYALFSLAALSSLVLARRPIDQPVLRTAGWLLSLVGVTTLAAMAVPGLGPGPVIGSGGYLGAAGRGVLELNFASVGAYILAISLILGGLLLCTDYVLVRLLAWVVGKPTKSFGRGVIQAGMAYAHRVNRKAAAVEPREEKAEEDEEEPAIRIVSPSANEAETEEEPDAEEEDQEEYEEERSASRAARKPFASWLRMKKSKTSQHQQVIEKLDAAGEGHDAADYELPGMDLLLEGETLRFEEQEKEVRGKAKVIEKTFADFGFNVRVVEIQTGPVVAQYEVELEAGLRLSKITGLADDLAIALRVPSVRIVAPIPGKNTVGIEVPNSQRHLVRLREVMEQSDGKASKMRIPIYLGKDVAGNPMVVDLAGLPHLLIAGRTGTGKSVCLNSIIVSMLMTRRPDEVRLLLIDPKMVELSPYKQLPHLMHPVVTDMRKAEAILAWAVEKMEQRYQLLARAGVRHISVYNQLGEEELMERMQPEDEEDRKRIPSQIPYVVIVADEMADLMMTAAKEVEGHIIRLAQKSRAVGIHLVMATQKPTVDIITGLIKSNLPARICFQVASRTDSRVVLDEMGADKLLGNGDMLFLWPGHALPLAGYQHTDSRPGDLRLRRRNLAGHRRGGHVRAALPERIGPVENRRQTRCVRSAVRQPRRTLRGRRRYRHPRGTRQRFAVAAGVGYRLRPGGPADRLYGRRWDCRPIQRVSSPRSPDEPERLGGDEWAAGRGGIGDAASATTEQQDPVDHARGRAIRAVCPAEIRRDRRGVRRRRR